MIQDRTAFILENTRLQVPPHTPELRLHLADEITPIWRLTEERLAEIGLPPPFWAFAWAGGQAVARHVLDHPELVAGRQVLDFATGSGLVAIAAMLSAAKSVLASDVDDFCGPAVALNAAANGVQVSYTASDLLDGPVPDGIEVILAGDICYEQPLAGRVLAWLTRARAEGRTVLIGDPMRTYFPREGLIKLAEYQVPTTRELEDFEVKRSSVWAFP